MKTRACGWMTALTTAFLLLIICLGCDEKDGVDFVSPDGDDDRDLIVLKGTGTSEGNPAIVNIGMSTESDTGPQSGSVQFSAASLRLKAVFMAYSEQCNLEDGQTMKSSKTSHDLLLSGSNPVMLQLHVEAQKDFCALDLLLSDVAEFKLEGKRSDGLTVVANLPLDRIPFSVIGDGFRFSSDEEFHWTILLDLDELTLAESIGLAESDGKIVIGEDDNSHALEPLRKSLVEAFVIFIDSNRNGLADTSERTEDNSLAKGNFGRISSSSPMDGDIDEDYADGDSDQDYTDIDTDGDYAEDEIDGDVDIRVLCKDACDKLHECDQPENGGTGNLGNNWLEGCKNACDEADVIDEAVARCMVETPCERIEECESLKKHARKH